MRKSNNSKTVTSEQTIELLLKQIEMLKAQKVESVKEKPVTLSVHKGKESGKFTGLVQSGNIRYYITSDILEWLSNHSDDLKDMADKIKTMNLQK